MKKASKITFKSMLIILITFTAFMIWDNNRIKVVKEEIVLENLPDKLDGFKILQLTDLHEKEFGKNQKYLLKKINAINYDVLVLTGDMLKERESDNYQPLYTTLEGINNKKNTLVVAGNDDPSSYVFHPQFGKSDYIKGIEKRGGSFLEAITTIEKEEEEIHFVNLELAIIENTDYIGRTDGSFQEPNASNKHYNDYQKELWEDMVDGGALDSTDVVVALNHFPIPDARMNYIKTDPVTTWPQIDLIIAGHYHGGQIRLPYFGALFIPDPWYEPNSFFPPQNRVKGLWEYDGTQQYVSAGLGTSSELALLNFRLFNPPEINLLTLRSK